jgi:hypothetical protein
MSAPYVKKRPFSFLSAARRQKKETIRAHLIKTLEDPPKRDRWLF